MQEEISDELSLLDRIQLHFAELAAQEPMTTDQFDAAKLRPNATIYDALYDEDDDRWGN